MGERLSEFNASRRRVLSILVGYVVDVPRFVVRESSALANAKVGGIGLKRHSARLGERLKASSHCNDNFDTPNIGVNVSMNCLH